MSLSSSAQENILVYSGPGVGPLSLKNTISMIQELVGDKYQVQTVDASVLKSNSWQANTALLVMPGGADRPYLAKLKGLGNENIKAYVHNGGKYLGICAGAYYSGDRLAFSTGDNELEVTGERELKFFPGLISGPTYPGFDHRDVTNYAGTRAAKLQWENGEAVVFYNGGGSFVDPEKYPNVTILARYLPENISDLQYPVAIVDCKVGKGVAILSGPHFEWDPETLDLNSEHLAKIYPQLKATNESRLALARYLLDKLELLPNVLPTT